MNISKYFDAGYVYDKRDRIIPVLKQKICRCANSVGLFLTENDRRILALKDIHKGKRAFVIGSGPSLKIDDLDKLKNEITFACNKIYLAFDMTEWRPTYYSVIDKEVAHNNRRKIKALDLMKIFGYGVKPYFEDVPDIIWLSGFPSYFTEKIIIGFSRNILRGVYSGETVIYHQLQMAYYMGISIIYLIGLDFSFTIPKNVSRDGVLKCEGEVNHFLPDYRKKGETWTVPKLDLQYKAFTYSRNFSHKHQFKIHNASRKTKLDVFPCIDFDNLFPNNENT